MVCYLRMIIGIAVPSEDGVLRPTDRKSNVKLNRLLIIYNTFDDIYISPDTNVMFIEEILKLNSNIEIVD